MRESNSILFWLTEGTSLMPQERLAKTRVVQWMCFEQRNIDQVLGRTRFLKRYPHFMATTQKEGDQWYAVGYRALDVMEQELAQHAFLVGDEYSAADICLYGHVHCAEDGDFNLARYAQVARWRCAVQARARFGIDDVGNTFPPNVDIRK